MKSDKICPTCNLPTVRPRVGDKFTWESGQEEEILAIGEDRIFCRRTDGRGEWAHPRQEVIKRLLRNQEMKL